MLPPARAARASHVFCIAGHTVGAVIGRGGSVISAIRARTGCSIRIEQQERGQASCPVFVSGPSQDAVDAARQVVLAIAGGEYGVVGADGGGGGGGRGGRGRGRGRGRRDRGRGGDVLAAYVPNEPSYEYSHPVWLDMFYGELIARGRSKRCVRVVWRRWEWAPLVAA